MGSLKGTLYKVESNHNRVRTNEMEGTFEEKPYPGRCFSMYGESLELRVPGAMRIIRTSIVQAVTMLDEDPTNLEIKTLNSTYRLKWSEE